MSQPAAARSELWQLLTMADATSDGTSRHVHHRAGVLGAVLASGGVMREQIGASPAAAACPRAAVQLVCYSRWHRGVANAHDG